MFFLFSHLQCLRIFWITLPARIWWSGKAVMSRCDVPRPVFRRPASLGGEKAANWFPLVPQRLTVSRSGRGTGFSIFVKDDVRRACLGRKYTPTNFKRSTTNTCTRSVGTRYDGVRIQWGNGIWMKMLFEIVSILCAVDTVRSPVRGEYIRD